MLRKIRDITPPWNLPPHGTGGPGPCYHPEHNPPSMIVLTPGVYEHVCPGCGARVEFRVEYGPTCSVTP